MSTTNKNKPCVDSGLCRCCGNTKKCRLLNVEYEWMGQKEVYSDMFVDCFGLLLSHLDADPADRLICATCVTRLREACLFKRQVLQCEQKLLQAEILVDTDNDKIVVEIKQETADDSDHQFIDDGNEQVDSENDKHEIEIKLEPVMEQKKTTKSMDGKRKLVKKINTVEHLKAKKEMLSRIKKIKEKLRQMQRVDRPPAETKKVDVPKSEDKEMNAIHNVVTIIENSYVCPFYNSFSDYYCVYCNEMFIDPNKLRDHTLTHNPSNYKDCMIDKKTPQIDIARIDCRLCPKSIDDFDLFKSHITSVHGKEIYENVENEFLKFRLKVGTMNCTECDAPFSYFHGLKRHMAEHFGTHICDVCGAHYFDQHGLNTHMKRHEEKKPESYACKQCDRVFKSQQGINYHIMHMHTRNPSYPCYKCDEVLPSAAKRYRHMIAVHGEHRQFPCDSCDRVYDNRKALREHNRRNHLKVLKHECTVCDKKFYQPSALRDHMTSHTGERNFRCEYCGKTYPRMKALRVHLQSHDSEKRYKCNMCSAAYTQANNLKNHMKTKHQGFDVKDDIE